MRAATRGEEGLRLLDSNEFDLVILDIDIAGEDGLAFLERAKSTHPNLPVVMFTGLGSDPLLLRQAMKLGANGHMAKTEPLADLFARVQKLIHTA